MALGGGLADGRQRMPLATQDKTFQLTNVVGTFGRSKAPSDLRKSPGCTERQFDGKTSRIVGAGAIAGRIVSAVVIDGNTIETTTSREGRDAGKSRIALSNDGKVMTVSTTSVREDKSGEALGHGVSEALSGEYI
jgi:hypothetical protein